MASGRKPSPHNRLTDAEFREWVQETKDRHNISDVISRVTTLKPAGRERRGLCFVHKEKSGSLFVNDELGVFMCHGCGEGGDIIRAVMLIENCDFGGAMRWLGAADLPKADPAKRVQAIQRDTADRAARMDVARQIWMQSVPLAGTPGEAYLRTRGVTQWPSTLRFTHTWWWCDHATGETSPDLPAIVGMVQNVDGFGGIQRIFLKPDGSGKAAIAGGKAKLSLGAIRGGALMLGPPSPEIYVCEGPEDGLSLAQERPGISVWVSLGTANMPQIRYPAETRKIIICAQNDAAGDRATEAAAAALVEQGYMVDVRRPLPQFKDWNDQLMGKPR